MGAWRFDRYDLMLFSIGVFYIVIAPFTKVEESFNVQATHDIIFHKSDLEGYDHHEFSGVVPRTFVGSLFIAALAAPASFVMDYFLLPKVFSLGLTRILLTFFSVTAISRLRFSIECRFNRMTSIFLAILLSLQFHIPFYFGRMLPNTFAFIPVTFALAFWTEGRVHYSLSLLVFSTAVFRCDMLILMGSIVIYFLFAREANFFEAVWTGIKSGVISLTITILIDSVFWRRWIWPEGEVMWFNTIQNRSSEYGISPFYWYFSSALPRACHISLPLFVIGAVLRWKLTKRLVLPTLLFIFIYSFLPHKELRFIFVAIPAITAVAAVGLSQLWVFFSGRGMLWKRLLVVGLILVALVNVMIVSQFVRASVHNYPGGYAMQKGQSIYGHSDHIAVFVGVEAAMKGVSRFLEHHEWSYYKTDSQVTPGFYKRFDLVLSSYSDLRNKNTSISKAWRRGYLEIVDIVEGFDHFRFGLHFPRLMTTPRIVVLKRLENDRCSIYNLFH